MSNDSIKPINVAEELSQSFLEYSMSVIISRRLQRPQSLVSANALLRT